MSNSDRVHTVLEAASELSPAERAAFLDVACGGDAALRAEVESLLKSHDQAGRFLADPTAPLPANSPANTPEHKPASSSRVPPNSHTN